MRSDSSAQEIWLFSSGDLTLQLMRSDSSTQRSDSSAQCIWLFNSDLTLQLRRSDSSAQEIWLFNSGDLTLQLRISDSKAQEIWLFSITAVLRWQRGFIWCWCPTVLWCLVPLLISEHRQPVRSQCLRLSEALYARSLINWVYKCWNIQQRDTGNLKLVRWPFSL
jgi:hypothetical protein